MSTYFELIPCELLCIIIDYIDNKQYIIEAIDNVNFEEIYIHNFPIWYKLIKNLKDQSINWSNLLISSLCEYKTVKESEINFSIYRRQSI